MWAHFTYVLANTAKKNIHRLPFCLALVIKEIGIIVSNTKLYIFMMLIVFFFEYGIGLMSLKRLWLWACPQNQVSRSVTLSSFFKSSQLKAGLDRTGWYTENERNYCCNPRSGGDQTSPPEKPMHLASRNIRGTRWQCTYLANMVPWKCIS